MQAVGGLRPQEDRGQPHRGRGVLALGLQIDAMPCQPLRCSSRRITSAWAALVTTARRSAGIRGSRRSTVAWSMDSEPSRRSTCLGYWERLRGQKRVPRPPARIRPVIGTGFSVVIFLPRLNRLVQHPQQVLAIAVLPQRLGQDPQLPGVDISHAVGDLFDAGNL